MADYDILIKAGTIVDGTRTPRFVSDVAIKDGKIAKIGGVKGATADKILDASGLIVAPGFVDLHTHYDAQLFWDPYFSVSGWHGVTSVAIGNCGFGFAPCRPADQERSMLSMTRNEAIPFDAMKAGMPWDWVTFPEYLDSVDRVSKSVNVLSYVPLSPIYAWVMGFDEAKSRRPTSSELAEMQRLVHEGMDAGGGGWSAQVFGAGSSQRDFDGTPMITDLMTDSEILAFGEVLAQRDEGFIELAYRGSGEGVTSRVLDNDTIRLFEELARVSNRPILYQVVRAMAADPDQHRVKLRWLEDCAQRGLRVFGQGQTYRSGFEFTFEDWNLFDSSPIWREVTLGSVDERLAKMKDAGLRAQLRSEWDSGVHPFGEIQDAGSIPALVVEEAGSLDLQSYVGKSVGQIANEEGKHVIDALLDLVVQDNLQTEFYAAVGRDNPHYTAEILKSSTTVAGVSDGGAHVKFMAGGTFTTDMLTWLVRDEGVVSLEDAHYKLSYLPAFVGGFHDRGFLREGAPADVIVYDLENLAMGDMEIVHDLPDGDWRRVQHSEGYRWTIVNGQITLENGHPTGLLSGKLLRHGRG
ncbi:amidohydrolase family protein [SAR202 cluster bacterium AD-804-J14_MRT_500m]|nr:amidohydrolase family protein [SAR202 cluster bacterium AD-804-J14_MRT_500m]